MTPDGPTRRRRSRGSAVESHDNGPDLQRTAGIRDAASLDIREVLEDDGAGLHLMLDEGFKSPTRLATVTILMLDNGGVPGAKGKDFSGTGETSASTPRPTTRIRMILLSKLPRCSFRPP